MILYIGLIFGHVMSKVFSYARSKVMSIGENQGSPNMHSNVTKREWHGKQGAGQHICAM